MSRELPTVTLARDVLARAANALKAMREEGFSLTHADYLPHVEMDIERALDVLGDVTDPDPSPPSPSCSPRRPANACPLQRGESVGNPAALARARRAKPGL